MTQREDILAHLESGEPITPLQALNEYGCFRLGARIHELKSEGYAIESEMVEVIKPNGQVKQVARYWLRNKGEASGYSSETLPGVSGPRPEGG